MRSRLQPTAPVDSAYRWSFFLFIGGLTWALLSTSTLIARWGESFSPFFLVFGPALGAAVAVTGAVAMHRALRRRRRFD